MWLTQQKFPKHVLKKKLLKMNKAMKMKKNKLFEKLKLRKCFLKNIAFGI